MEKAALDTGILTFSLGSEVTTTPRVGLTKAREAVDDDDDDEDARWAGIREAGGILGRLPETGRHTQVNILIKASTTKS